jgi:hypothetical protein
MLTEKSTERKSQPQLKKKGTTLLAGYFGLPRSNSNIRPTDYVNFGHPTLPIS